MEISPNGGPGEHAVRRVGMEPRLACVTAPIPRRHLVVETALDKEVNHVNVLTGYVQVTNENEPDNIWHNLKTLIQTTRPPPHSHARKPTLAQLHIISVVHRYYTTINAQQYSCFHTSLSLVKHTRTTSLYIREKLYQVTTTIYGISQNYYVLYFVWAITLSFHYNISKALGIKNRLSLSPPSAIIPWYSHNYTLPLSIFTI